MLVMQGPNLFHLPVLSPVLGVDEVVLVVEPHGKYHQWNLSQPQFDAVTLKVVDVVQRRNQITGERVSGHLPPFLKQNKHVLQWAKNFAPSKN